MDLGSLNLLRCPFCLGGFEAEALDRRGDELHQGFLRCACDRYPVVAGIPVLRKDRRVLLREVHAALAGGRPEDAFLALIGRPLPHGLEERVRPPAARRALRRLHQRRRRPRAAALGPATGFGDGGQATTVELLALYCDNSPEDFHYLAYRFGQPRHLVALALGAFARRRPGPLLDLGCGCGHVAFALRQMQPGEPLIGIDTFYFGLWIASRRMAPGGTFLCCRAGSPHPFRDDLFSSAVCFDSFHYFRSKSGAAGELQRVVEPGGLLVLTGLHNRLVQRALQFGDPLSPGGYSQLFSDTVHRLLADHDVLDAYLSRPGLDLPEESVPGGLEAAPLLSLIASPGLGKLPAGIEWPEPPPHALGPPAWNPLYARRQLGEEIELTLKVPSPEFAADQGEGWRYLPRSMRVPADADAEISRGEWTPLLRRLSQRFVVLALPPGFVAG